MAVPEPSRGQKRFLVLWCLGLLLLFTGLGFWAIGSIELEKLQSNESHRLRMDPLGHEPGKTPPDPLPSNLDFIPVKTGIYLDGVDNFSIRDSCWVPTFFIWFSWKGDPSLDPGKAFQVVDARIERKELLDSYAGPDGINYQRYKVVAKVNKFFNTTRIPLDDHMLNIYIEDGARDASRLRYVADPTANRSSRVKIPGYRITGMSTVVKGHTYKTSYGDPRMPSNHRATFTEYIFALTVQRSSVGIYFKLFTGLFAGALLTIGSFLMHPSSGPRFHFASAAYFGIVANAYLVHSMLPSTGQLGLADLVTIIGLVTILVCFGSSLLSARYYLLEDGKGFAQRLDQVSWITIGLGFLGINIVLPLSAYTHF